MFGVYTRFSKSQVESALTITHILWAFQRFQWKSLWKRLWISCGRNVDDLTVVNRIDDARLWKSKTRFKCRLWITSQKSHEKKISTASFLPGFDDAFDGLGENGRSNRRIFIQEWFDLFEESQEFLGLDQLACKHCLDVQHILIMPTFDLFIVLTCSSF